MNRHRLTILALFALSLALYLPSVESGFAYDDHVVVRLDDRIHDLGQAGRLFTEPYWADREFGLYRPLTSLSFAVDWALSDGDPSWFHLTNSLWNALAVVLVFLFLSVLAPGLPAVLGTLLFATHPVHVEAVANIVGRAEVITAVFSLIAMNLWIRADASRRLPPLTFAAVAVCYVLALLSKESGIMLPALLALCDVARGELPPRRIPEWLRTRAPIIITFCITAAVYLVARTVVTGGIGPALVDPALDVASTTGTRIMTALQAWPVILRLLVFPLVLLADYGPRILLPALSPTPLTIAGALLFGGALIGGFMAWTRGRNVLAAALLFIPVAMLPTSNLIVPIGVLVAERTLYLPSLALALAVALLLMRLPTGPARHAAVTALLVVCALFTARTLIRIPEWRSTSAIHHALQRDAPDSFRAQWYSAREAIGADSVRLAVERYAQAMTTWPYRQRLAIEAAVYAVQAGDSELGFRLTSFGVSRWPGEVRFLRLHAALLLDRADTAAAREFIRRGLVVEPADTLLNAMNRALSAPPSQP